MAVVEGDAAIQRPRDGDVPRQRQTRRLTETGVFAVLFFAFAEVAIQLVTLALKSSAERYAGAFRACGD